MSESNAAVIEPALLRPRDAAKFLGVSDRHLWGLTAAGLIPSVKLGRSVRYSVSRLRDFIDAQQEAR